jgi:hypothetical protein
MVLEPSSGVCASVVCVNTGQEGAEALHARFDNVIWVRDRAGHLPTFSGRLGDELYTVHFTLPELDTFVEMVLSARAVSAVFFHDSQRCGPAAQRLGTLLQVPVHDLHDVLADQAATK